MNYMNPLHSLSAEKSSFGHTYTLKAFLTMTCLYSVVIEKYLHSPYPTPWVSPLQGSEPEVRSKNSTGLSQAEPRQWIHRMQLSRAPKPP